MGVYNLAMSATTARSSAENSPPRLTNAKSGEQPGRAVGVLDFGVHHEKSASLPKYWSVTEVVQNSPDTKVRSTIKVIFDFRNINYHKDFSLIQEPEVAPKEALTPAPRAPAQQEPETAFFRSIVPTPHLLLAQPPLPVSSPPKSYPHMSQKSILAPLSGYPVEQKKPRLEDKKLIEFMIFQTSKSCSDSGYLQRVKKTIKKIKLYWNKSNLIYPFAFRKLKTKMVQKPASQSPNLRRGRSSEECARGETGNLDQGFFIITEDFSKKRVNPDGPSKSWDLDLLKPEFLKR